MKANEAPERIYINPNLENRTWLIGKGDISFIEYTRTDAFIEKAVKWLKENGGSYWMDDYALEVKEVDLEKELIEWYKEHLKKWNIYKDVWFLSNK